MQNAPPPPPPPPTNAPLHGPRPPRMSVVYGITLVAVLLSMASLLAVLSFHEPFAVQGAGGPQGHDGSNGAAGAPGAPGAPGTDGSNATVPAYTNLSFDFSLSNTSDNSNLMLLSSGCVGTVHGAYNCLLTLVNSGFQPVKLTGLAFPLNVTPVVYYAGADPTIGHIEALAGEQVSFSLAFQSVGVDGAFEVSVVLFTAER